jgi:hypothetical protein
MSLKTRKIILFRDKLPLLPAKIQIDSKTYRCQIEPRVVSYERTKYGEATREIKFRTTSVIDTYDAVIKMLNILDENNLLKK